MRSMQRSGGFILIALVALTGCRIDMTGFDLQLEAMSLDGRLLARPQAPTERQVQLEQDLEEAEAAFRANPGSEDPIIWLGRRLGYLGRFRDAIEVYRAGLDFHPDSFRLRRHLGHRLITVRELDRALAVLSRAAELIEGVPDEVEPDGQPNALNQPRSTTHFNIWYHLALAKYLTRDFAGAADAWQKCLEISTNDDSIVAASYWLYLARRRAGDPQGAGAVLGTIRAEMDVIENHAYHELLLMFQGQRDPDQLLDGVEEIDLDFATIGYGTGMKEFLEGDRSGAEAIWRRVMDETNWAAFGHIASEADWAALRPESLE